MTTTTTLTTTTTTTSFFSSRRFMVWVALASASGARVASATTTAAFASQVSSTTRAGVTEQAPLPPHSSATPAFFAADPRQDESPPSDELDSNQSWARMLQSQQQDAASSRSKNSPATDWDEVAQMALRACAPSTTSGSEPHPIILFDGSCNLCNGAVNVCLDWDESRRLRFASLQSKIGYALRHEVGLLKPGEPEPCEVGLGSSDNDDTDAGFDPMAPTSAVSALSTIVLITPASYEGDRWSCIHATHSKAVLEIIQQLDGLPGWIRGAAKVSSTAVPRLVRDYVLRQVSERRHLWGHNEGPVCRIDFDNEFDSHFLEDDLILQGGIPTIATTPFFAAEAEKK